MEGATPPFFTGGTMDTLSFLQRVLPSEGFYVTTVINKDAKPRQGYFSTVDDLAKAVIASTVKMQSQDRDTSLQ
jgi:hypothetical protein